MRYKVIYLTSKDPGNRNLSSGIYYYQSEALKKHIGDIAFTGPVSHFLIDFIKLASKTLKRYIGIRFPAYHNSMVSKIYGRLLSKKICNLKADFIFADKASSELAFLKTNLPVIYSTDATFSCLLDYYPDYKGLSKLFKRSGNIIEQKAIEKARIVLCASKWAADSVINDYNASAEKTFVLPRGANVSDLPPYSWFVKEKNTEEIRLLFIGKDWKRKGFDIAFKAFVSMRNKGFKAKLFAVGFKPLKKYLDCDVVYYPFLDKGKSEAREKFAELMFSSDFLLMPTRAECLGITFCEATAYGLPVITTNTGGVSEIIRDGVNGFALPYEATPEMYADKIISLVETPDLYKALVSSTLNFYSEKLNWDVWALNLKKIIDEHIGKQANIEE